MSHFATSDALSSSLASDCLPPPPRSVAPNLRARWKRAGFVAGMVLGPLFVLWIGERSSANLRMLIAQGRKTTGQVVVRG